MTQSGMSRVTMWSMRESCSQMVFFRQQFRPHYAFLIGLVMSSAFTNVTRPANDTRHLGLNADHISSRDLSRFDLLHIKLSLDSSMMIARCEHPKLGKLLNTFHKIGMTERNRGRYQMRNLREHDPNIQSLLLS